MAKSTLSSKPQFRPGGVSPFRAGRGLGTLHGHLLTVAWGTGLPGPQRPVPTAPGSVLGTHTQPSLCPVTVTSGDRAPLHADLLASRGD